MIVSDYRWGQAKRSALARLSLAQRFAIEKGKAEQTLARLEKHGDVDFIQDPETGRFQGSRPHGHSDDASRRIEGLPANVTIKDRLLNKAIERDAFTFTAVEKPKGKFESGGPRYELTVTAKIPPGIEKFVSRESDGTIAYYNPKLADLVPRLDDEPLLRGQRATLKAGYTDKITPLPGDDIIYRGMSSEEYDAFIKTGEIVSGGEYNIGDAQKGLTYWTTDPDTAAYYASDFAPWPFKATFEKPAYVVATHRPKEVRDVPGTGENEVGVARPIKREEVLAVWSGDVYSHRPGVMTLRPVGPSPDETEYEVGASSAPSSAVAWRVLWPSETKLLPDPGMSHDAIQARIDKIAKEHDFDPAKIKISDDEYHFVLNGTPYKAAGSANTGPLSLVDEQPVTIYARQVEPRSIDGLIVHEIEHIKYVTAHYRWGQDYVHIMKEPNPPSGNPRDDFMNADGTLKPPYDEKYPAYQAMQQAYHNVDKETLALSDGVSNYSIEWWKSWSTYPRQPDKFKSAVHETLAEIARIKHETGKFPDHYGEHSIAWREAIMGKDTPKPAEAVIKANAKLWRDLYRAVEKVWKLKP